MDSLTPWEICVLIVGGLMGVAAAINTLGSAVEKISKAWKAAKAPNALQDERLEALEQWKVVVDQKLSHDNDQLTAIAQDTRITQRALLALLDHGIDGNNIAQMQHSKEELQNRLINR